MSDFNLDQLRAILVDVNNYGPDTSVHPQCFSEFGALKMGTLGEILRSVIYEADREKREQENEQNAMQQARAQMSSISEMVAALNCDYDRLQELREERENLTFDVSIADQDSAERELAKIELSKWEAENLEELTELESAAGNCESEEEARERIQEDALDIQIRSGWQSIGETLEPEEFTILLCTGGPAVRIVGELDQYKQPSRARIEYQDWFTPWRELVDNVSHSDLLTYCQQFYFGE